MGWSPKHIAMLFNDIATKSKRNKNSCKVSMTDCREALSKARVNGIQKGRSVYELIHGEPTQQELLLINK